MQPEDLLIAWTTVDDREAAQRLANGLIEARLAACCQIGGPITSVYRWEGRIESAAEYRVMIKLPGASAEAAKRWIHDHHPYATPQWVVCRVADAGEKYLNWVAATST